MAHSINIIQNADYLTPEKKRDILYNNAAQFLRLTPPNPKLMMTEGSEKEACGQALQAVD